MLRFNVHGDSGLVTISMGAIHPPQRRRLVVRRMNSNRGHELVALQMVRENGTALIWSKDT